MALASSKISDPGHTELRASRGSLDQRWIEITARIGEMLSLDQRQAKLTADYQVDGVWVGFQGRSCERAVRNRGGPVNVIPLVRLPSDLIAWLGIQEVWNIELGRQPFVFRHLSLTVHFGFEFDPVKPQVMRLEWSGIRNWTGSGPSFQTVGAGHPHWQIDILQSLSLDAAGSQSSVGFDEVIEEFEPRFVASTINDVVRSLTIENMHLASAAIWWQPQQGKSANHAHAPQDINALSHWLVNSVFYLRQELGRCAIRST